MNFTFAQMNTDLLNLTYIYIEDSELLSYDTPMPAPHTDTLRSSGNVSSIKITNYIIYKSHKKSNFKSYIYAGQL